MAAPCQRRSESGFRQGPRSSSLRSGRVLKYAAPEQRADRRVVLEAVQDNGLALEHASEELRANRQVVGIAVAQNGLALQHAAPALRRDWQVVRTAVACSGLALQWACAELQNDMEIVAIAVSQHGQALQFASEPLCGNDSIVLSAISQDSQALRFASDSLRKDHNFLFQAISTNGHSLKFVPKEFQNDQDFMLAVAGRSALVLHYLPEKLRTDRVFLSKVRRNVVRTSVAKTGRALQHAHPELQRDRQVVLTAVASDGGSLEFAAKALRSDRDVVIQAIAANGSGVLRHASEALREELREMSQEEAILQARRRRCLDRLEEAIRSRQPKALREAIAEAEALVLRDEPAMQSAQQLLTRIVNAEDALKAALQNPTAESLRAATSEAEAVGLEDTDDAVRATKTSIALGRLQKAMSTKDVMTLEITLNDCVALGVPEGTLDEARMVLAEEQAKLEARVKLKSAMLMQDYRQIQAAIEQGIAAGLEDHELVYAKSFLAQFFREVQEQLKSAIKKPSLEALHSAINEAESAGILLDDLQVAKQMLVPRLRVRAAVQSRKGGELTKAMELGKSAGLKKYEIDEIQVILHEVQDDLRYCVAHATFLCDVDVLAAVIHEGSEAGLAHSYLVAARHALNEEREKDRIRCRLQSAAVLKDAPALVHALTEASAAAITEKELEEAKMVLARQQELLRRKLEKAVHSRAADTLQLLIREGQAAGLEDEDLAAAEYTLFMHYEKHVAQTKLKEALEQNVAATLLSAIMTGLKAELDIDNDPVFLEARDTFIKMQDEERRRLSEAIAGRNIYALRDAIKGGEDACLAEQELRAARIILREEEATEATRMAALSKLDGAMRTLVYGQLQDAISACSAAGTSAEELVDAKAALAEAHDALDSTLKDAVRSHDADVIAATIKEAEEAGFDDDTTLKAARKILELEKDKVAARRLLYEAVQGGGIEDLQSAIIMGESVKLKASELAEARKVLFEEEQIVAARVAIADAIESGEVLELEAAARLAEDAKLPFEEIAVVDNELKKVQTWVEVRSKLEEATRDSSLGKLRAAVQQGTTAKFTNPSDIQLMGRAQKQISIMEEELRDLLRKAIAETSGRVLIEALEEASEAEFTKDALFAEAMAELEQLRNQARKRIKKADDVEKMEEAIKVAQAACLPEAELADARDALEDLNVAIIQEKRQGLAHKQIKETLKAFDTGKRFSIGALKSIIKEAEAVGLPEEDMAGMRKALEDERRRNEVRARLKEVLELSEADTTGQYMDALEKAVQDGKAAKLLDAELAPALQVLNKQNEELQVAAKSALRDALASGDAKALQAAIAEGVAAQLPDEDLRDARSALRDGGAAGKAKAPKAKGPSAKFKAKQSGKTGADMKSKPKGPPPKVHSDPSTKAKSKPKGPPLKERPESAPDVKPKPDHLAPQEEPGAEELPTLPAQVDALNGTIPTKATGVSVEGKALVKAKPQVPAKQMQPKAKLQGQFQGKGSSGKGFQFQGKGTSGKAPSEGQFQGKASTGKGLPEGQFQGKGSSGIGPPAKAKPKAPPG